MSVVGARPNFMKIAPLLAAFGRRPDDFGSVLVHTGQHYDVAMSDVFFHQLGLPEPDLHLGVSPGSHATQTAEIMIGLERAILDAPPDLVLVVGDVNSTLAAAIVAAKLQLPLAHVEAGLRSGDRRMPEEINRVVTDALGAYLFATESDAVENLAREGIESSRVCLAGNVMIDTLDLLLPRIHERALARELGLEPASYGVLTLHRASNVDDPAMLGRWASAVAEIAHELPLVFPVHPRTAARLRAAGDERTLQAAGVRLVEPLPYVEFLSLVSTARLVLTDSGGIQEETSVLGIPCLTLRDSTERPITVTLGTNRLVGTDPSAAVRAVSEVLATPSPEPRSLPWWDGHAAERIAAFLADREWTLPGRTVRGE